MVRVYFKNFVLEDDIIFTKGKNEIEIKVEGHTGLGFKGADVVCSAISALVQTSILAINRVAKINQKVKQRDGYLKSSIPIVYINVDEEKSLKIILNTMIVGLNEIDNNYPGTLEISYI
ncbi:MAG: ribosomal-processing cysteine protease Prp [Spirochaetota bacterium]|nr:ribosomal-processing cysteine protease Prp [Spirochaetota bacterium]